MKIIVHFCVTLVAEVFLELFFADWRLAPSLAGRKLSAEKPLGQGYFCALLKCKPIWTIFLKLRVPTSTPTSGYPKQLKINCKGPQTKMTKDEGSIYRRSDQQKYIKSGHKSVYYNLF